MLVLSRQEGQSVVVGEEIEVTVMEIRGDKVRLGVSAPAQIPVHRREVFEAIRRHTHAADDTSARFERRFG